MFIPSVEQIESIDADHCIEHQWECDGDHYSAIIDKVDDGYRLYIATAWHEGSEVYPTSHAVRGAFMGLPQA